MDERQKSRAGGREASRLCLREALEPTLAPSTARGVSHIYRLKVGEVRHSTRWAAAGAAVGVKGHWVLL